MKLNIFLGLVVILVQGYAGMTVSKRSCLPTITVCGSIPEIANGAFSGSRIEGSVANLTCDEGFIQAIGQSEITCQSDGNWEEVTTECVTPGSLYVTVFPKITESSEATNDRLVSIATFRPTEVMITSEFESTSRSLIVSESTDQSFNTSFTLENDDEITNRVIVIRANDTMTVHTIEFRRGEGNLGYLGFFVRPVEQLTDEYLLVVPTFEPQFNVIAVEDDTIVTIEFRNGSTFERTLQMFEVYSFIANDLLFDFSGTRITSNNKISVIAGAPFTNIPSNTGSSDGAAVQLVGVAQWSNECILAPFLIGDIPYEYKIVASDNDTVVTITDSTGSTSTTLDEGEVFLGTVLNDEAIVIEATKSILVAQFSYSRAGNISNRDPSMVLCQPPNAYLSSYVFRVPRINVNTNVVRVIIESDSASSLNLNGGPVPVLGSMSSIELGNKNYSIIYIDIQRGSTNLLTASGVAFGADYYGTGSRRQLAYSLGWGYS